VIGSSKRNSPKTGSANAPLLVAGSHTLCVRTEPSWRKVAGLTFTSLPFLDSRQLITLGGLGATIGIRSLGAVLQFGNDALEDDFWG
jgi:hypothetical protein